MGNGDDGGGSGPGGHPGYMVTTISDNNTEAGQQLSDLHSQGFTVVAAVDSPSGTRVILQSGYGAGINVRNPGIE